MKVSMNGLRKSLSDDVRELRDVIQAVISDEHYDKDDLINAANQVICDSNVMNCVYVTDDPDFTDMSEVEVDLLEVEDV